MGSERVEELAVVTDADFGKLRLLRHHYKAKVNNATEWTDHQLDEWRSDGGDVRLVFEATGSSQPVILAPTRRLLLGILANDSAVRREIAEQLLELAVAWAADGDLTEPTIGSFAASLKLIDASLDSDGHLSLTYEEIGPNQDQFIFAGHVILAELTEDGKVCDAAIAG